MTQVSSDSFDLRELEKLCKSLENEGELERLIHPVEGIRRAAYQKIQLALSSTFERNPQVEKNFPFFLYRLGDTLGAIHFMLSEIEVTGMQDVERVVQLCEKAFEGFELLARVEPSESELVRERDARQSEELAGALRKLIELIPPEFSESYRLRAQYFNRIEDNQVTASGIYEAFLMSSNKKIAQDYEESAKLLERLGFAEGALVRLIDGYREHKTEEIFSNMIRLGINLRGEEETLRIFEKLILREYPYPWSFHRGGVIDITELGEVRTVVNYFQKHLTDHPWYPHYFASANSYCNTILTGVTMYEQEYGKVSPDKLDDTGQRFFLTVLETLETQIFYLRDFSNTHRYLDTIESLSRTREGQAFLFDFFANHPLIDEEVSQVPSQSAIERCGTALSSMEEEVGGLPPEMTESQALEEGFLATLATRYNILAAYLFGVPSENQYGSNEGEFLTEHSQNQQVLESMKKILDGKTKIHQSYSREIEDHIGRQGSREQFLVRLGIESSSEFEEFRKALAQKYSPTVIHIIQQEAGVKDYVGATVPLICLGKPDLCIYFYSERILAGYAEQFIDSFDEIFSDHMLMYIAYPQVLYFAEMLITHGLLKEAFSLLLRYPESANNLDGLNCIVNILEQLKKDGDDATLDDFLAELDEFSSKMMRIDTFESLVVNLFESYDQEYSEYIEGGDADEDELDQRKSDLALSAYIVGMALRYSSPEEGQNYLMKAKSYGSVEALVQIAFDDLNNPQSDKENILDGLLPEVDEHSGILRMKILECMILAASKLIFHEDKTVREKARSVIHQTLNTARIEGNTNLLRLTTSSLLQDTALHGIYYSYFASVSDDEISGLEQDDFELILSTIQEDLSDASLAPGIHLAAIYAKIRLSTVSERTFTLSNWGEFFRKIEESIFYLKSREGRELFVGFTDLIFLDRGNSTLDEDFIGSLHAFATDAEKDALWTIKHECIEGKKIKNPEKYRELLSIHIGLIEGFLRIFGQFEESKKVLVQWNEEEGPKAPITVYEYWKKRYIALTTTQAFYQQNATLKGSEEIRNLSPGSVTVH